MLGHKASRLRINLGIIPEDFCAQGDALVEHDHPGRRYKCCSCDMVSGMEDGCYERGILQIEAQTRTDSHGFLQILQFPCVHHGDYEHGVLQIAARIPTDSHGFLQIAPFSCMHHGG